MTKRIRITRRGVFRSGTDMVPVGTELDVPSDFKGWPGKWVEVSSDQGKTLEVATPEPQPEPEPDDATTELRDQYEQIIGKRPGPRMKAETMQRHIDEALEQ